MIAKIRESVGLALKWLTHVIREPRDELDRWQRAARFTYDLGRYGARQLREDRAAQMAGALAFQMIFAMVPILVVATILVRAVAGSDQFLGIVNNMLDSAGLAEVPLPDVGADAVEPQTVTLREWLADLIGQATEVNVTAAGWIGSLMIVFAAINLLVTIENSFNTVYRAPEGRSWTRRIPLYWFLLTLSPCAVFLASYVDQHVEEWAVSFDWGNWFSHTVTVVWSVAVGWLFWFAVYSLVPNTDVDARTAAIGAFVCVILLELGKQSLGAYLSNAPSLNRLYGSLGSIPVFMLWVYFMWLAVLFGLQVSAALQFLGNRALEEMETRRMMSGLIEPATVVTVLQVVAEDFREGKGTQLRRIAERTGVPERTAATVVQELCSAGLLHRIDRDQNTVCLSQPPELITADRAMDVGFRLADAEGTRWVSDFAQRLRDEQRALAGKVTLASLVGSTP
ncbi:MAG: YihY/virulence factor BrkB family protein [Planctomycetota bacterium]|nr:MAG: YihY/virulence factor BrkB family protein [Planctomycetota bacterium]REJ95854.1 MAG: YihY/virulence factor BrkB family protein [Planctomycetota bacterium]REK20689.1 MAG: YihY/virulence factor BrkB family protein [Planctomycetota bacterium]REK38129.1 MAG: YihY/virulence factor BrkB family protein [Planctomycetota bacterium]